MSLFTPTLLINVHIGRGHKRSIFFLSHPKPIISLSIHLPPPFAVSTTARAASDRSPLLLPTPAQPLIPYPSLISIKLLIATPYLRYRLRPTGCLVLPHSQPLNQPPLSGRPPPLGPSPSKALGMETFPRNPNRHRTWRTQTLPRHRELNRHCLVHHSQPAVTPPLVAPPTTHPCGPSPNLVAARVLRALAMHARRIVILCLLGNCGSTCCLILARDRVVPKSNEVSFVD